MTRDQRKIDAILSDVAALLNVGATTELHSGDAIARELLEHAASDLAAAYWRLRDDVPRIRFDPIGEVPFPVD